MTLTVGSTFSGIGVFDKAFQDSGMDVRWQVEKDKYCIQTLERHFPDIQREEDIHGVGKHNLAKVDIICGGFPCQDLSVAGKREGLAGDRSGLWFEFHRLIQELRPEWVVIENVVGLLSSNKRRDFAVLLGGLTGLLPTIPDGGWGTAGVAAGPYYKVAYRVLDSRHFGVPQRRRRVFIVGHFTDGRAAEVLFESDCLSRSPEPGAEARKTVGTLSGSGAGTSRTGNVRSELDMLVLGSVYHENISGDVTPDNSARALRSGGSHSYQFTMDRARTYRMVRSDHIVEDSVSPSLAARDGKSGQMLVVTGSEDAVGIDGRNFNIVRPEGISSTLQADGASGHAVARTDIGVRRLTPLECERLQGLEDGWTDDHSDAQRYKQTGNAVTYNVVRWLADRIQRVQEKYN